MTNMSTSGLDLALTTAIKRLGMIGVRFGYDTRASVAPRTKCYRDCTAAEKQKILDIMNAKIEAEEAK